MAETFGELLRRHRIARGFTQEALAEHAAISSTAVAALERGRRRAPRLSTLRQIARALDLDPDELAEMARAATAESGEALADISSDIEDGSVEEPLEIFPVAASSGTGALSPGELALPTAASRRWRTDFIGRDDELGQLVSAWEQRRRFNLVLGESGVGKTRLTARLSQCVHDDGGSIVWGRCSEERLGAYAPFVEILRQLVSAADPVKLSAAVGSRGELTRLIPELVDKVGTLRAPTRAEAGTEQRLLFESVATLLGAWSPLVLVLDDLHWADEATMALLGYLVGSNDVGQLVIVGTVRDTDLDPLRAGLLADFGRSAESTRLHLDRFGREELSSLVSDLLGSAADGQLVESIASATDGNPFFIEEMTVHLIDSDMIAPSSNGAALRVVPSSLGVPERVRDTLARRLLSLTPDANELMSVGSLIGRDFDLSTAATACGLDPSRLVEAADDALLSGLVVEARPGRLSFSHALVQHAVDERLSFPRKAAIHRRIAEALEVTWERDPSVVADLARHWGEVATVDAVFSATAATWAVRAGDMALASAAADEAIARYEQASSLWATTTTGHADALIRLGLALQYRGRADEADARLLQANHLAVALGHAQLQARAAIGLGRRYSYWETDAERIQVLEDSLAALPESEDLLRPTLMAMLVTHLIAGFNMEEARHRDELAEQVRSVAADQSVKSEVLLSIGQTRIYDCFDDPAELSLTVERLAKVADRYSDLRVLAGARFAQAIAALDQGDLGQLRSRCDEYAEVVDRLDDPRERSQLATARSTIAFIEGRYPDAATLADQALDEGQASGDFNAALVHYAQGILRAVDLGQAKEVLPLLIEATEYQNIVGFAAGTALCAALAGDHDRAREALNRFAGSGFEGLPRGADWLAPTAFLAHVCAIVGAREHASGLYSTLSNQPSTCVRVGPLIGWWGPVDHHLGSLCLLMGRLDDAERHLQEALNLEERIGARPFAARTLGVLSATERARSSAHGGERADSLLDQALALTVELESPGIADEIRST